LSEPNPNDKRHGTKAEASEVVLTESVSYQATPTRVGSVATIHSAVIALSIASESRWRIRSPAQHFAILAERQTLDLSRIAGEHGLEFPGRGINKPHRTGISQ
jgi:hypothetical protein